MKKRYFTNPSAESACGTIAGIFLTISIINAIIVIIVGYSIGMTPMGIIVSLVFITTGLFAWALVRVFVNISRSLYNIDDILREDKNTTSSVKRENDFRVGQLVIVKDTEKQFRITSKSDGEYYSDSLKASFKAEDLQDFDAYWAEKKKN